MKLFIKLKDADSLPSIEDLKRIMWFENASISRIGNENLLRIGEEISLSWDKWIDDEQVLNFQQMEKHLLGS